MLFEGSAEPFLTQLVNHGLCSGVQTFSVVNAAAPVSLCLRGCCPASSGSVVIPDKVSTRHPQHSLPSRPDPNQLQEQDRRVSSSIPVRIMASAASAYRVTLVLTGS
jgi:hypothetical protein